LQAVGIESVVVVRAHLACGQQLILVPCLGLLVALAAFRTGSERRQWRDQK
jgi:hypothetical protein